MTEREQLELFALRLGKLLLNLLSIEMLVRTILDKEEAINNLPKFEAGERVKLSQLTNTDTLTQVLTTYNAAYNNKVDIDKIVPLRDAIAHGRLFGYGPREVDGSLRLVKFKHDKTPKNKTPKNKTPKNEAEVECSVKMNKEWFDENLQYLQGVVNNLSTSHGWGTFPIKGA